MPCFGSFMHQVFKVTSTRHQVKKFLVEKFSGLCPDLNILKVREVVSSQMLGGRIGKTNLIGNTLSSPVPSSNSLGSVLDPWRAFWADTAPFKGPQPQRVNYFRKFGDTRTPSRTTDANLDCVFVKNALAFVFQKLGLSLATPFWTPPVKSCATR